MDRKYRKLCVGSLWLTLAACDARSELVDAGTVMEEDVADGGVRDATVADARGDGNLTLAEGGAPDDGEVDKGQTGVDGSWCAVQGVLEQHCVACHTSGGVGPFALEAHADLVRESPTYAGVAIYERVGLRVHDSKNPMPPKGLLDDAALRTIDRWIADGAPDSSSCAEGEERDAGAPAWPSNCDATYRIVAHAPDDLAAPYVVPAGVEIHPKIAVDAPWGDEEVQAIAFRPITDNAKVLHHWILNASDRTFLSGWAPGGNGGAPLPSDVGMYMPRGQGSMFFDMHYFNLQGSAPAMDQSGVEICVLKKEHFRTHTASVFRGFTSLGGGDFVLAPAGSVNHDEEGVCQVKTTEPVHLLAASPHAHTYAVHMKFTLQKADGREIVMHDRAFTFEAQGSYALSDEVVIETGDTVHTVCTYTNETAKDIRFGESTTDEMCFNFAAYYPMGALSCAGRSL